MEFKEIIKSYLDKKAQEDPLFAEVYASEEKNIDDCCKYIYQEASKKKDKGNVVGVEDSEVYGWAVHYYQEKDLNVGNIKDAEVSVSTSEELESEQVPVQKASVEKPKQKKLKKELINESQLSLF